MWITLVLAGVPGGGAGAERAFSGAISVVDGDTIDVGDVRVRLLGIDAPEQHQHCGARGTPTWACGAWVTHSVRQWLDAQSAHCVRHGHDRYGRVIARCSLGGQDIGAALVATGLAFAAARYSDAYVVLEAAARAEAHGLHATRTPPPATVRRGFVRKAGPNGCRIKGNLSRNGRIYHLPGQRFYDATRIDPARGERWFCSEQAARAAGWRRAQS